jgi:hypothetical protein
MDDYGKDFKGNIKIESVPTLPAFVSEAEDKRRLIYAEDEEKVYYGGTAAYKEAGGTSGTSGVAGTSGTSGAAGTSGTSGDSGTSGSSGNSGTSGTSGVAGTSGTSGVVGTSGTSGVAGTSGTSGTSGVAGTSGTSGVAGTSGTSGNTGTSGTSGSSGVAGTSGTSGTSGVAGTSGTSGVAGTSGTSGSSGNTGTSGTSGVAGTSGTSGVAGTSGTSGSSGVAGTSGTSGVAGTSGTSGSSGAAGTSGTSGSSGAAGTSGTSGVAGTSGTSGSSGAAGTSGTSGLLGTAGTTNALTITAIRGTELAPAITEANWDTNVAGWVHPVVGGVLDKGSAGDYAEVRPTGATAIEANCLYELVVTIVNSPTTGTFVSSDINIFLGNSDWVLGLNPTSTGTYTCLIHTKDTTNITIAGADASRFGVSAISVKKLTEGNLVIAEGSIKTGAPSSESNWGTAAAWKLGSVVNNEIEVEVGGDTVKRMLVTTTSLAAGTEQIRGTTKEIYKTADADSPLTAVECAGTIVSNYGMADADCTIELPAAAEGLSFVCILPAVQAHFFKLHAGATDKIYLLGVAGSDNGNVGVASGYATGASASFFTFKTGGTPDYDWFCIPIFGTWVAS